MTYLFSHLIHNLAYSSLNGKFLERFGTVCVSFDFGFAGGVGFEAVWGAVDGEVKFAY